jgi:hypothetical protein
MPYIKQEDRAKFDESAVKLGATADCAGELNYIITVILHTYLKKKGIKYSNINEVLGVLTAAQLELYRSIASPYEDIKIKESGLVGLISEFGIETRQ